MEQEGLGDGCLPGIAEAPTLVVPLGSLGQALRRARDWPECAVRAERLCGRACVDIRPAAFSTSSILF